MLPQPLQGGGDIQHVLWGGGNERNGDIHQGRQIGTKLLPAQIADAAHTAGNGHRELQPLAYCHSTAGGQGAADTLLQSFLQMVAIDANQLLCSFPEGQVFPDGPEL